MTIIPALCYALVETVYVIIIDPKFYENVYMQDIAQYKKTLSPAAYALKLKEVKQELVLDKNPLFNFSMMVLIIAAYGILVTLISSLLLMRKAKKETLNAAGV